MIMALRTLFKYEVKKGTIDEWGEAGWDAEDCTAVGNYFDVGVGVGEGCLIVVGDLRAVDW